MTWFDLVVEEWFLLVLLVFRLINNPTIIFLYYLIFFFPRNNNTKSLYQIYKKIVILCKGSQTVSHIGQFNFFSVMQVFVPLPFRPQDLKLETLQNLSDVQLFLCCFGYVWWKNFTYNLVVTFWHRQPGFKTKYPATCQNSWCH